MNNKITECFIDRVNEFTDQSKALNCRITRKYGNPDDIETLNEITAKVSFEEFTIEYVYTLSLELTTIKSVLDCRISFDSDEEWVHYSMYDLMHLIDDNNFRCYIFPFIENENVMGTCFDSMEKDIIKYLPELKRISKDQSAKEKLYTELKEYIRKIFRKDIFNNANNIYDEFSENIFYRDINFFYSWKRTRYFSNPYVLFLEGKYKKAEIKYSKDKNKSNYEERLLKFIKGIPDGTVYKAVDENNRFTDEMKEIENGSKSEFFALMLCTFIMIPIFMLIYGAVYFIAFFILNSNFIYNSSAEVFNAAQIFLPSFITSFVSSYFFRKRIYRIVYRKKSSKMIERDSIVNTYKSEKFMRGFFHLVVVLSILYTILLSNKNIQFENNCFKINESLLSLKEEYYSYTSIKRLKKTEDTYNLFGKPTEYTLYSLELKNGKTIELDQYISFDNIENKIIPLLKEKGVEIVENQ